MHDLELTDTVVDKTDSSDSHHHHATENEEAAKENGESKQERFVTSPPTHPKAHTVEVTFR